MINDEDDSIRIRQSYQQPTTTPITAQFNITTRNNNNNNYNQDYDYYNDNNDSTLSSFLLNSFNSIIINIPDSNTLGFISLCSFWYIASALSSNSGKAILTSFSYPVALTFIQFAFVAAYSVLFITIRQSFASPTSKRILTTWPKLGIKVPSKSILKGTFMMSLFQISGHIFSSMAIARVPVSTVHTIKALSPLFTVVSYAALFKIRYSTSTYIALLPLTLGVMLACSFDLRANAVGFLCALGSTLIFVSQNIFSKKLLPKDGGSSTTNGASSLTSGAGREGTGKLDKLNLLFYSSGMAFVLMIPIWLWTDAALLFSTPVATTTSTTTTTGFHSLLLYFWLNGTVHFTQNLLAFSILSKTSPVTYSIASLVKRIAVICLAIIWSGQVVTLVQGLGMTMTFFGLWLYNRAKGDVEKGERKRGLIEKRASMSGFLPTTGDEARVLSGGTETPPLPLPNSLHRPSYTSVDTDPDFKTLPQQQSHPPQLNHYSSPPTYIPSPMSIVNPPPPPPSTAAATTITQTLSAHKSPTLTKSSPPTTTAATGQQGNYRRVYHQPSQYTPLSPPQPPPPLPQHQAIPIHR